MTASQYAAMLGQTLQGYYLASDDTYKPVTLTYGGSTNISSIDAEGFVMGSDFTGVPVCWYSCSYPRDYRYVNTEDPLWMVEVNVHFGNVSYFKSLTCNALNTVMYNKFTTYPLSNFSPYYDICVGDTASDIIQLGSRSTLSGSAALLNMANSYVASVIPFEIERQQATDLYIGTANYCCVAMDEGVVWIGFAAPLINTGYTFIGHGAPPASPVEPPLDWGEGQSVGEVTGTIEDDGNGTQNINVTVTTDNSGFVAAILNGLRSLFVPSQEYMNNWHEDIQTSFSEHLGGVSEAVSLIDEQVDYLRAATSADYIYFPELTLPIGSNGSSSGVETIGADYTLIQGQQVELRPARTGKLKILWDFVEFAVDVVCVLAVFNMLQTKYEIFLNPDGEVISYDH